MPVVRFWWTGGFEQVEMHVVWNGNTLLHGQIPFSHCRGKCCERCLIHSSTCCRLFYFLYFHIRRCAVHTSMWQKVQQRWMTNGCMLYPIFLKIYYQWTYPNFPVEPKIVWDIISRSSLSKETPFGSSATWTNADSYPPEISLDSIPAALLERGFTFACNMNHAS